MLILKRAAANLNGGILELSSTFTNNERIPAKYANHGVEGGENTSPLYTWASVPNGTKSFALALIDRNPVSDNFVHWLVIDIPAEVTSLDEGASMTDKMPDATKELFTSYRKPGYGGPRPPAGSGDHQYETTIWALSVPKLGLSEDISLGEFMAALDGKILDSATLTGLLSQ